MLGEPAIYGLVEKFEATAILTDKLRSLYQRRSQNFIYS